MDEHRHLPDINRLSVLTAVILLAYAVTPFIQLPSRPIQLQLPGFFLTINLNFATFTSLLAAALSGVGADWLIRDHPRYHERDASARHWLLPALTAWVISVPLNRLEVGFSWWGIFSFGGLLLLAVVVSEYIALDPGDIRYAPAAIILNAVAFALFLVLAVSLRAAGLRLYGILSALGVAVFLASLRTLYLRLGGRWVWKWPLVITIVIGQMVTGLHYWPLTPLQFGLILVGATYALVSTAVGLEEGRSGRALLVEPLVMILLSWIMAFLVRG